MQAHSDHPAEQAPELRIAPEPEETDPETEVYATLAEHLQARTMVVAEPESHLVAALLNASTEQAAQVLAIVTDTDVEGYLASVVIRIIRQLVDTGTEPTPQAVVARARVPLEPEGIEMNAARPSLQRLVLYVSEVYTMGMPVRPWADAYQVVEDSYRRSFEQVGRRMAQMAEACADVEDLEQMTSQAVRQWRADWHRLRRLRALPHPSPAMPLTAVPQPDDDEPPPPPEAHG